MRTQDERGDDGAHLCRSGFDVDSLAFALGELVDRLALAEGFEWIRGADCSVRQTRNIGATGVRTRFEAVGEKGVLRSLWPDGLGGGENESRGRGGVLIVDERAELVP
jgi:hypothetical protein